VRRILTLSAWILVLPAVHVGLCWPMLMSFARNATGVRFHTVTLRCEHDVRTEILIYLFLSSGQRCPASRI